MNILYQAIKNKPKLHFLAKKNMLCCGETELTEPEDTKEKPIRGK